MSEEKKLPKFIQPVCTSCGRTIYEDKCYEYCFDVWCIRCLDEFLENFETTTEVFGYRLADYQARKEKGNG